MSGGEARVYGSVLLGPAGQTARQLRVRVQVLLTVLLVGTNVIGAVLVFVLSTFVIPSPDLEPDLKLALAISVPVYVGLAVFLGAGWGTAGALRALRWSIEDREPDEQERLIALGVPWFLTRIQAGLWLGGTVLFTLLTALLQPARAVTTALTVGIASLVVGGIAFLFTEFALRPVAARALSGEERLHVRGLGVRRRMVLFWSLGTGAPVVGLVVTAILALTVGDISVTKLAIVVLVLGGVVLCFGLLVTWLNARAVVAPILGVRDAMEQVEEGELDVEVEVYDGTELGQLQAGFNQMVAGLREREKLRDLFGRHVGHDVAAAAALGEAELGGETRVVSVLFIDIVGSTTMATEREPAEVVALLNRFFGVVVEEVDRHSGTGQQVHRRRSARRLRRACRARRPRHPRPGDRARDGGTPRRGGAGARRRHRRRHRRGRGGQRRRRVALRVHRHRRRRERRGPDLRPGQEGGRALAGGPGVGGGCGPRRGGPVAASTRP